MATKRGTAAKGLALTAALALLAAGGCSTPPTHQQEGTVIGGIVGGLLGSTVGHGSGRAVAIAAGTLAGAMIGGSIGHSMDRADRMKLQHALETDRTHHTSRWRNPDTGNVYAVTPTHTYQASNAEPCRDYVMHAVIDGQRQKVHGTACRQPDGTWQARN